MVKFIQFLDKRYTDAEGGPAVAKDIISIQSLTGGELLTLHNLVASNLGRGSTRRFSDNEAARRRTWAILQAYNGEGGDEGHEAEAPTTEPVPAPPIVEKVKAAKTEKVKKEKKVKEPVEKKRRGPRFVFPAESEVKPVRADSARGKALAVLLRPEGATFDEVCKVTDWNEKRAYEGIRLLHYYSGYGLAEDVRDGVTYIRAHTGKK
jgi:hypothetical protein